MRSKCSKLGKEASKYNRLNKDEYRDIMKTGKGNDLTLGSLTIMLSTLIIQNK